MPSPAFVATLVVDPAQADAERCLLARAAQALPGATATRWLDPGVAADLFFDGERAPPARDGRCALAREARADVIVQPLATRAKRLLVADMDSTLIGQECIDELAAAIGIGAACRRHHRTRDARRNRIRTGAARARRAAGRTAARRVIDDVLAQRITLNAGARDAGADDARARRLCRDRLRRLHAVHRRNRAAARRATNTAPTGWRSRTAR